MLPLASDSSGTSITTLFVKKLVPSQGCKVALVSRVKTKKPMPNAFRRANKAPDVLLPTNRTVEELYMSQPKGLTTGHSLILTLQPEPTKVVTIGVLTKLLGKILVLSRLQGYSKCA